MLKSLVHSKWPRLLWALWVMVMLATPVYGADRDEFRRSIFQDGADNEVLLEGGNTGTGHMMELFDGTVAGGDLIYRIYQSGSTAYIEAIPGIYLNYTTVGGIGSGNAFLGIPERASDPSTPISNLGILYCKDDGTGGETLYWIDSAGNVVDISHVSGDLDISFVAPATPGSTFDVVPANIDIDALDATSFVHVFNITTTGTSDGGVEALATHGGNISPVHQHIGTFVTPHQVQYAARFPNGGSWTSNIDGETIFVGDDDVIYFGDPAVFDEVEIILTTPSSHAQFAVWEYLNDSEVWVEFIPADTTNDWQQNGIICWVSVGFTDWDAAGDPGGVSASSGYWVRARRERNNVTTDPVITTLKILDPTEYEWNDLGDLYIRDVYVRNITPTGTIDFSGGIDLDDGAGDSPDITFIDGDDNTLVIKKLDSGAATITNNEGAVQFFASGGAGGLSYTAVGNNPKITTTSGTDLDLDASAGDVVIIPNLRINGHTGKYIRHTATGSEWFNGYNETDDLLYFNSEAVASQSWDYAMTTIAIDTGNAGGITSRQQIFEVGYGGPDDSDGNFNEVLSIDKTGNFRVGGNITAGPGTALALYVNKTSGTDAKGFGFASGASATATVQYCIDNLVPTIYSSNVTINITAESYAEDVVVKGKYPNGDYVIKFVGTLSVVLGASTVDAGVQGTGAVQGNIVDANPAWGDDDHNGLILLFDSNTTTGALQNQFFIIDTTVDAGDFLYIVGTFPAQPVTGDVYYILTWGTTIDSFSLGDGQKSVELWNIHLDDQVGHDLTGAQCSLQRWYCKTSDAAPGVYNAVGKFSNLRDDYCVAENVRTKISQGFYRVVDSRFLGGQGGAVLEIGSNATAAITAGTVIDADSDNVEAVKITTGAIVEWFAGAAAGYQVVRNADQAGRSGILTEKGSGSNTTANVQFANNTADETTDASSWTN